MCGIIGINIDINVYCVCGELVMFKLGDPLSVMKVLNFSGLYYIK